MFVPAAYSYVIYSIHVTLAPVANSVSNRAAAAGVDATKPGAHLNIVSALQQRPKSCCQYTTYKVHYICTNTDSRASVCASGYRRYYYTMCPYTMCVWEICESIPTTSNVLGACIVQISISARTVGGFFRPSLSSACACVHYGLIAWRSSMRAGRSRRTEPDDMLTPNSLTSKYISGDGRKLIQIVRESGARVACVVIRGHTPNAYRPTHPHRISPPTHPPQPRHHDTTSFRSVDVVLRLQVFRQMAE